LIEGAKLAFGTDGLPAPRYETLFATLSASVTSNCVLLVASLDRILRLVRNWYVVNTSFEQVTNQPTPGEIFDPTDVETLATLEYRDEPDGPNVATSGSRCLSS